VGFPQKFAFQFIARAARPLIVQFNCLAEELVELLTEEEPKVAFDSKTSSKDDVEPAPGKTAVMSSPTSATKTAAAALALSGGQKRPIGIKPFGPASRPEHCM
jgi:hypothetical protein